MTYDNVHQFPLPVRMQENAQAALPVLPNNGNPQGAYNMAQPGPSVPVPATPATPATQPQGRFFYPWMEPSDSISRIRSMLTGRSGAGAQPAVTAPTDTPNVILPMRNHAVF